jgi:hypothetical protein
MSTTKSSRTDQSVLTDAQVRVVPRVPSKPGQQARIKLKEGRYSMAKPMEYEQTPVKKTNSKTMRSALISSELGQVSTWAILWYIVKRHKVGLLITSNIILLVLYMFPRAPQFLVSLI